MSDAQIWLLMALLAVSTYLIRFSFLGILGDRALPGWIMRALRFAPVAVLPALVAPSIFLDGFAGETHALSRYAAIAVTLAAGIWSRSFAVAFLSGLVAFLALGAVLA